MDSVELRYKAYLLRQLLRQIDDMIDLKVMSYEEYRKFVIEKKPSPGV